MTKKTYKVMTLSALAMVVAVGCIMPTYTVAAQNTANPIPGYSTVTKEYLKTYSLGPEGLKKALEETKSNLLVMDLYALTIIKQAPATFEGISSIDNSLKKKITQSQDTARNNANHWLDVIKPQIISTNQNIVNYNTQFQNYHDTLVKAVDTNNKETLKKGLFRLSSSITNNKKEVDKLINDLKEFRKVMSEDTQNFKSDSNNLESVLNGNNAILPGLRAELESYNEALDEYNKGVIASASATATGGVMLVVGAALTVTGAGTKIGIGLMVLGGAATVGGGGALGVMKRELDSTRDRIKEHQGQITTIDLDVITIDTIKNQITSLSDTIDIAITALQNISNQWHTMGEKYNSLLKNVESISAEDFTFIKEDLNVAKDSWKDVKDLADKMNETEIKFVEKEA